MPLKNQFPIELNTKQEQVLLGSVFGDACIGHTQRHRNPYLKLSSKDADRDYIFWKYEQMEATGLFAHPPEDGRISGFGTHMWDLRSCEHVFLLPYRRLFYPEGRKTVSQEALDRLAPLGLAVWYMDDGCLEWPRGRVFLYTQGFDLQENERIRAWFTTRWGFDFHLRRVNRGKVALALHDTTQAREFLNLTRPFAVPCMSRKWGGEL